MMSVLPTSCITQTTWSWAADEVRVWSTQWREYPDVIIVIVKNIAGLRDGLYALCSDSSTAASIMTGHGTVRGGAAIQGDDKNRIVFVRDFSDPWWGETYWRHVSDSVTRIEVDDDERPVMPVRLAGRTNVGVAVVRSREMNYKVLVFKQGDDGNVWSKADEFPIGTGTQSRIRVIGAVLALPPSLALDVILFPVQAGGCCLAFPQHS